MILRGYLAISGDIFSSHNLVGGECYWLLGGVEIRDAAKYPTMYQTAPQPQQKMIRPKMLLLLRLKSPDLNSGMSG